MADGNNTPATAAPKAIDPFEDYEDGLTRALEEVSALLVTHFPRDVGRHAGGSSNELPDAPVIAP